MADDENEKRQQLDTSASELTRKQLERELDKARKMGIDTGILPSDPKVFDDVAKIIERAIMRQREEPTTSETTGVEPIPINTKRRDRKPKPKKP